MREKVTEYRWFVVAGAIALLGVLLIALSGSPLRVAGDLLARPEIGYPAPDFTLPTLDGGEVTLSELRGSVVVVNFWTSWCPPCREEMPALEAVYNAHRADGLVVLGLNSTVQDNETRAGDFIRGLGLTFPIVLDRDGQATEDYLLQSLPTTYFIDRQGIIRDIAIGGPMRLEAIEEKLAPLWDS